MRFATRLQSSADDARRGGWFAQRLPTGRAALAQGFTLIEVLVGCALVATLGLAIGGILFTLIGSERFYLAQTDRYESLRLPANLIVEDVRHAWSIDSCGTSSITLWMNEAGDQTVEYRYRALGGGRYELRRAQDTGGGPVEEIVASNLAQPKRTPLGSLAAGFECSSGTSIHYILALQSTPAGGSSLKFDGSALQR